MTYLDDLLMEFTYGLEAAGDPEDIESWIAIARTCLENHGFDFTSANDIDEHIRAFDELLADWKTDEEKLRAECWQILIDSGATELQLQWGNVQQAHPNWRQRRKLREIAHNMFLCLNSDIAPASYLAALREAKKELSGSHENFS